MDKQTLYKYFEGTASLEEEDAIYNWLDASPDHENVLLKERKFFDAMILSGSLDNELAKATKSNNAGLWLKPWIREVLKIAAVVAIVIACALFYTNRERNSLMANMNTVIVPAGQRVNLKLPDGTSVWVNSRSRIVYPAIFSGSKREITLEGEAYFEVVHKEKTPFIVHTHKCNVEVLGTKFNVEAYSDTKDYCTSLMQGSVKISDKTNPSASVVLKPNQEVRYKGNQMLVSTINDFEQFRWREGLVCFNNVGFDELMKRFETCYGISIVVKNKNLKGYTCSGKFRVSDGLDNALRILQKNAQYTFERNDENTIVYIK